MTSTSDVNGCICDLNALYDWSLHADELRSGFQERRFADYIAWKIPFPGDYAGASDFNRAIRSFCVDRLICKLVSLGSLAHEFTGQTEIFRSYSIVSEPNLWASEVGVVFSMKKWEQLLYRDIEALDYSEKTTRTNRTLFESFGVLRPLGVSHMHMSHIIEDRNEKISFQGGLHALWIDQSAAPSSG